MKVIDFQNLIYVYTPIIYVIYIYIWIMKPFEIGNKHEKLTHEHKAILNVLFVEISLRHSQSSCNIPLSGNILLRTF